MNTENKFIQAESEERFLAQALMKHLGVTDYNFSEIGTFACFDLEFKHMGVKFKAEIKVRDCDSDTYSGLYIEKLKFDCMQAICKEENSVPLYINFFNDGNVFIFRLDNRLINWTERLMNKSTMRSRTKKVTKVVAELTKPDSKLNILELAKEEKNPKNIYFQPFN